MKGLKACLGSRPVQTVVPADAELIYTDNRLLEQVLVNLIENACKYSPADTPIRLVMRRDQEAYELTVIDQGPGIPVEERERVFDRFHRVHATDQHTMGTGMGLAICKGMVEALGGTIQVGDVGNDTGTLIVVRLPQPRDQPSMEGAED